MHGDAGDSGEGHQPPLRSFAGWIIAHSSGIPSKVLLCLHSNAPPELDNGRDLVATYSLGLKE